MLDAANPLRRKPGQPEVTVRAALDAAEAKVDERFFDQPVTAMNVLGTLGMLRTEFGEYDAAAALYQRAMTYASRVPQEHLARLVVQENQAALNISMQDFAAATPAFEALVAAGTEALGADNERTLGWSLRLLESRSRQGADPQYRDDWRALADRADAALGRPNRVAGEAWLFIAHSFRAAGIPDAGAEAAARARGFSLDLW